MPLKLKLWVCTATATGLLTLAAAVAFWRGEGLGAFGELAAFTAVLTLGWLYPLRVLRREDTEAYQFDEALFVAMALLLPPLGIVLSFGASALISQLIRRRPLSRIAFNTGVQLAATTLALAVMRLAGPQQGVGPAKMTLVVGAALVWLVVNSAFVWVVLAIVEGQSVWQSMLDSIGFRMVLWASMVAIGLLCGLATSAYTWSVLLAVLPLAVLEVVLAGTLRGRQERQQLDGLLRAAAAAHASVQPADVEDAVLGSARELLLCRESRLSETPPGDGELGCRLPGPAYPERWLVVGDRRGVEPFGSHDVKLLEALAGVSASALDNAGLVEQLKHEAFHDALTGLPNQLLFEETVGLALAERRRPERKLAVFVLDLDRFKRVNDSLGHPAGNELLKEVARRLMGAVRTGDTVARMSGDEFTVLVTGLRSTGEAAFVAEKVMAVFRAPFVVAGQELHVTPSLGIAVAPEDGTRSSVLLKNADTAMYRAKERGRNCFEIYSVDMNSAAEARLSLEADLHNALGAGELRVVYQPQIDMLTGQVTGVEALARWNHPALGAITPDTFIPLAEESGLIVALDDWVMRTACAQARAWADAGLPRMRMAVNLSGRDFGRAHIVERVTEVLAHTGVDPDQLELEVTESMAIDAVTDVRPLFRELEALGVRLAIDDFGTGYSALGRLQGLPFHTLKIDRSFVIGVENPADEAPIVAAMIAMAHALNLEVVAEGVENEAQHAFLLRHGCDVAQGYLFGRPAEASEIERMLRPDPVLAA